MNIENTENIKTSSKKPYLVRAIYQWCVDNKLTPYLVSFVDNATTVPSSSIHNEQIVLNISENATHNLILGNKNITFDAKFDEIEHNIVIPIANVLGLFGKENSEGMHFQIEEHIVEPTQQCKTLKLVK